MRADDTDVADVTEAYDVIYALIGTPAEIDRLVGGGRNSRIYRVQSGSKQFALKQYPTRMDDPRDRLSTEVGALNLMEHCGINTVPRVAGVDRQRGFVLLSWIEGAVVTQISDADIDAAVHFLSAIHNMRDTKSAIEQPEAAEACLSGAEIERQIRDRLAQLNAVRGEGALASFLKNDFIPVLETECIKAKAKIRAVGLDFGVDLPQEWRSLVPSDFGFHNSLRRKDGSLAFVDFEYFGWDDPVKLSADVLLHPGRTLAALQRRRFRQAVCQLYGADPNFAERLGAYLPLFGLRWVLILLNEFIPERWQRRVLAGASDSWTGAKTAQLELASDFLAALPGKVRNV